jgi:NADH dehydrogenase [ubiquinone] 1 alpha subcomplex assembly factor 1
MMTHRIRTIGISILGGNSGVEGRYELGLDVIKAVNEVSTPIILAPGCHYGNMCNSPKDDLDVIPRSEL